MSDIDWMTAEAYSMADRIEEALNKAYKQGVEVAWNNVQTLFNKNSISFEWSADEMMHRAENADMHIKEVEKLAEEMGIHALYAMVASMRGE